MTTQERILKIVDKEIAEHDSSARFWLKRTGRQDITEEQRRQASENFMDYIKRISAIMTLRTKIVEEGK